MLFVSLTSIYKSPFYLFAQECTTTTQERYFRYWGLWQSVGWCISPVPQLLTQGSASTTGQNQACSPGLSGCVLFVVSVLVFPCWLEKHDVCRTPTQFNIAEVLWESPWLCWSVLLPGTRWCRRHRWGWAVCACWWTTSPTGCHSWPNALPYHSDWMRCPVAGPHAVLSDDHNSTWRRQESESGCKIGI